MCLLKIQFFVCIKKTDYVYKCDGECWLIQKILGHFLLKACLFKVIQFKPVALIDCPCFGDSHISNKPLLCSNCDIDILLFLPSGSLRNAKASIKGAERILQKLRGRTEFTVLLTIKQEKFSSGVLLSIHYGEQRYC